LRINYYQHPDGTMFFAPDVDPKIPAALAGKILGIGGLDDFPRFKAHLKVYPATSAPATESPGPPVELTTPGMLKTAYNLDAIPVDGSGQSVALVELGGYSSSDIEAYESGLGLPAAALENILIDGGPGGAPSLEATSDIEVVAAFAPGSKIVVYETPGSSEGWMDGWTRIAQDDSAKAVSCSCTIGLEEEVGSPALGFDTQVFQQMAAQGQSVFVASGDSGAFTGGGITLALSEPVAQPYVTAVGESGIAGFPGPYVGEYATPKGGGASVIFPIPSYQAAIAAEAAPSALVSTTMRNIPDVVADAVEAIYYSGTPGAGGTFWQTVGAPASQRHFGPLLLPSSTKGWDNTHQLAFSIRRFMRSPKPAVIGMTSTTSPSEITSTIARPRV
jgi:kumamolisin